MESKEGEDFEYVCQFVPTRDTISLLDERERYHLDYFDTYRKQRSPYIQWVASVYYYVAIQRGIERNILTLVTAYQVATKVWIDDYDNKIATRNRFNVATKQEMTKEEFLEHEFYFFKQGLQLRTRFTALSLFPSRRHKRRKIIPVKTWPKQDQLWHKMIFDRAMRSNKL